MRLFPYVLARVAGGPFEKLEALNSKDTIQIANNIHELEKKRTLIGDKLSNTLYELISAVEAPISRSHLINIKRDIFNGRSIQQDLYVSVVDILPVEINRDLENYIITISQIHR